MSDRSSIRRYQSSVKPAQSTEKREALKENTTRIRSGRCRKKYTAATMAPSQRGIRISARPRGRTIPGPQVEQYPQEHRRHHHERRRRPEGPVPRGGELVLDQVPDQHLLGATQEVRGQEGPQRRDEHQEASGHDAGQREREGDPPEARGRPGPEHGGGLEQREVLLLQGG